MNNYEEKQQPVQNNTIRTISATYQGSTNTYAIPTDGAWISGKGIRMQRAYRIFQENHDTIKAEKVQNPSELECAAQGLYQEVRRILKK